AQISPDRITRMISSLSQTVASGLRTVQAKPLNFKSGQRPLRSLRHTEPSLAGVVSRMLRVERHTFAASAGTTVATVINAASNAAPDKTFFIGTSVQMPS